jgi:hypothetical protein
MYQVCNKELTSSVIQVRKVGNLYIAINYARN